MNEGAGGADMRSTFLERNDMNGIPGERAVIPYGSGSSGQQCFPGLTGTCMEE